MTLPTEIERRYGRVREAAARDDLDAVIVAGSEYTGFEGAVTYLSGFVIVHRYAYVLLPLDEPPAIVFPSEARFVGEHGTTWIAAQEFVPRPGEWLRDRCRDQGWKRVGVYGLDYVMTVRDFTALQDGGIELVSWDVGFDHARAVKSSAEVESVRDSVRINTEGFWIFLEGFAVGRTEAEILAACERYFVAEGCGRLTMDMVLVADEPGRATPEFRIASPSRRIAEGAFVLPSLEVAGPGGHWVEVSRAIKAGGDPNAETRRMAEAYEEYATVAPVALKAGGTAHDAHRAVAKPFADRGYTLGHVTGHSIGMTMIEFPKIGEGVETVLEENMVLSVHPHVISEDGRSCLYMQETWLVTRDGGLPLSGVPMRIFDASETRPG
jgi:Xaa-Pro aminopeptidase